MSDTVRLSRIRAGEYALRDWRIYSDGDVWIVTNRNGMNWVSTEPTLRAVRELIARTSS